MHAMCRIQQARGFCSVYSVQFLTLKALSVELCTVFILPSFFQVCTFNLFNSPPPILCPQSDITQEDPAVYNLQICIR